MHRVRKGIEKADGDRLVGTGPERGYETLLGIGSIQRCVDRAVGENALCNLEARRPCHNRLRLLVLEVVDP